MHMQYKQNAAKAGDDDDDDEDDDDDNGYEDEEEAMRSVICISSCDIPIRFPVPTDDPTAPRSIAPVLKMDSLLLTRFNWCSSAISSTYREKKPEYLYECVGRSFRQPEPLPFLAE